jgi:hypothetical protein
MAGKPGCQGLGRTRHQREALVAMHHLAIGHPLHGAGQAGQRRQHIVGMAALAGLARAPMGNF